MILTKEAVEEFKQIYLQVNGVRLSSAEARKKAGTLIMLVKILLDRC